MGNYKWIANKAMALTLVSIFVIFSSGCIVLPHGHRSHGHHGHHDYHGKIDGPRHKHRH